MLRRLGLAWKMALLVAVGTGAVMGATMSYGFVQSRAALEDEIQQKALYLAQSAANRIETVEYSVEKVTEGMALALEDEAAASREDHYRMLERLVSEHPEIAGSAVAFAPTRRGAKMPRYAPYVYRQAGRIARKDLGKTGYHYDDWDWYLKPRDGREPVWTDPYLDEGGGNVLMVTYAVPFFDAAGGFLGVVTCDVALDWLRSYLEALPLGQAGYATLLARDGTYLAHPRRELIMRQRLVELGENPDDPALVQLWQRMQRGETGIAPFKSLLNGKPSWLAFAPIPSPGWSLAVVFPQEEALERARAFTRQGLLIGLAGFALLLLVVWLIARSITLPLRQLDQAVRTLVDADRGAVKALALPVVRSEDEVGRLSASFERMRHELADYLAELRSATAARERIESELRVAHEIQRSLIPPDPEGLELHGLLEPAREVGGDFYDFFMRDAEHLCLAIGDVSGKGVPAALFMAVTRTYLRACFDGEPAAALERLNDELAAANESSMFVSLFCCVIHLPSGECRYANGGHLPPVLVRDGRAEPLPKVRGALVGAMAGLSFSQGRLTLEPGDVLYGYTDGVSEALDAEGAFFGEARMREALERHGAENCQALLHGVRASLGAFVGSAEPSDDITMLAFRFR